jgi:hypothetical protein
VEKTPMSKWVIPELVNTSAISAGNTAERQNLGASKMPKHKEAAEHRTLDDFVEWQEAVSTRDRLAKAMAAIVEEQRHADGRATELTAQGSRIAAMVGSLLGQPSKAATDPMTLPERREAIRVSIERHDAYTRSLAARLSGEIYNDYADEHRAARRLIVERTLALKEAFDAECQLAHQIVRAGGLTGMSGRLWLNVSAAGSLRTLLSTMNPAAFRVCNANLLNGKG